jgi:hypothetical protein
MKKIRAVCILVGLLSLLILTPSFGQTNFTKVASVTTTAYTDSTGCITSGQVCQYYVTATANGLESGPSNTVTVTVPETTAAHSVTLSWSAGSGGAAPTGYNVYFLAGPVPPTGLAGVGK